MTRNTKRLKLFLTKYNGFYYIINDENRKAHISLPGRPAVTWAFRSIADLFEHFLTIDVHEDITWVELPNLDGTFISEIDRFDDYIVFKEQHPEEFI